MIQGLLLNSGVANEEDGIPQEVGLLDGRTCVEVTTAGDGACAVETQTASLRCDRGNTVTDGWSGAFKFEDFVDGCEGLTAHEEVQSRSLMVFVEEYPVGSCASVPRKSSRECTNDAFGEWVDDREYGETFSLCSDGCGRMRHGDETAT